jgi:hypothetical protein
LWKLIDEADVVVAHNWDSFDIKKMNVRFIKNWLWIPSPYTTIDTLKVARKNFRMTSNKLDYICKFLWFNWKIHTWWIELWKECVNWNNESLEKMDKYCRNDVLILEDLYMALRPYIKNHPNLNLYWEWDRCPNCWSKDLKWWYSYKTPNSKYESAKCLECWAFVRRSVIKTAKIKS